MHKYLLISAPRCLHLNPRLFAWGEGEDPDANRWGWGVVSRLMVSSGARGNQATLLGLPAPSAPPTLSADTVGRSMSGELAMIL